MPVQPLGGGQQDKTEQGRGNATCGGPKQRLLHGVCQSGHMSEGRFDAFCRNIGVFVE